MKTTAPYGTWLSKLSASHVAQGSPRLAETKINAQRVFWLEGRASEQGRNALVMCSLDDASERDCGRASQDSELNSEPSHEPQTPARLTDLLPAPWSARSKVHEYGGGAYAVNANCVYFVNGACQQVYHLNIHSKAITPLTNTPECRYGGLVIDAHHNRLLAICEDHSHPNQEPLNSIVSIPLSNDTAGNGTAAPVKIASGHDFYAQCAPSACGKKLAFITWDHPNMPWDLSQLWLAQAHTDGSLGAIEEIQQPCPGSVFQPQWSSDNELLWVSDSSHYWNLYRLDSDSGQIAALHPKAAEFATPLWSLGMRTYGALAGNSVFSAFTQDGAWQCGVINGDDLGLTLSDSHLNAISDVHTDSHCAVFIGASAKQGPAVWLWQSGALRQLTRRVEILPADDISVGKPFRFPSTNKSTCFANFYPPCNPHFSAPATDLPPTIFIGHGGPTGQADLGYNAKIQFWTQRGFAVVDVNYRGSTGFGRSYKDALKGQWGIMDVEDLCAAATWVTEQGWVAADKRIVRGSSAGGYTVLAALTDSGVFNAGVSLYGIGNLESLATDTHKFEARYLDSLIGPYPEDKHTYIQRSPIHKAHQIQCPIILFQGLEDKVVPPNQAQAMVAAVKAQGLDVEYVAYAGEGHGFRNADTVINQLESELAFYQKVFDLSPQGRATDL